MNKKKEKYPRDTVPTLVIGNATSLFSRLKNWLWNSKTGDDNDYVVIENRHPSIKLKSILKKDGIPNSNGKNKESYREKDKIHALIDLRDCNTKRRKRKQSLSRSGPRPVEELPVYERGAPALTHATLNSNFQIKQAGDGNDSELPGNKGLLTYFARLGSLGNTDEEIDLSFIHSLVSAGADINIGDKYGQTILHAIARDWHKDIAQFVISSGGNINALDNFGRTPLHVAAAVEYPEMVEFLVRNGANLHSKTTGELQTPMHYAAKYNAVESMKCLINLGGKLSDRDYKERTPLFVAAENGRRDIVDFMLGIEAPAAVYDNVGTCAVALMAEKMPDLAKKALDQFLVEDKPTRINYFHLCALEYDTRCKIGRTPAKSVLETIVSEENSELAQHLVITKLIEVKWEMIAKWQSILEIAANFVYACIFTALTVTLNFDGITPIYSSIESSGWRVAMEAIFVLISIYFIWKQLKTGYHAKERHKKWQAWRIIHMSTDFGYCHPQWPEEKRYIKSEIARIRGMQGSKNSGWAYYEWLTVLGLMCVIIIQVIYAIKPSQPVGTAAKFVYLVELFLLWIRLLKPMRSVPAMASLIVILSDIAKGSIQFLYIFMEFYIPLAIAFFIMFGGSANIQAMRNAGYNADSISSYETLQQMMFSVFWVALGGSFDTDPLISIDKVMTELMVSILFAVLKLVAMNLFISLVSYLFGRAYNKARATALLQSANYILTTERNLGILKTKHFRKKMRIECNPLATYETGVLKKAEDENNMEVTVQNINENVRKLMTDNLKDCEATEKVDEYEKNKLEAIMEDMNLIEKLHADAAKEFNISWKEIQENQSKINAMLKRPGSIATFLSLFIARAARLHYQ